MVTRRDARTGTQTPVDDLDDDDAAAPPDPTHHLPRRRLDLARPSSPPRSTDDLSNASSSRARSDDDDDGDDFGEFVYSGKDALPVTRDGDELRNGAPEEAKRETRGDLAMISSDEQQQRDRRKRNGSHVPSANGAGSDELPSLASAARPPLPSPASAPLKRPLASRASYGGSPSMTTTTTTTMSPRRPSYHPQISRLRSVSTQSYPTRSHSEQRFVSSSTYDTAFEELPSSSSPLTLKRHPPPPPRPPSLAQMYPSPSTSGYGSRRSSTSNLNALDFPSVSDLLANNGGDTETNSVVDASSASPTHRLHSSKTIKWSPLKRISTRVVVATPLPQSSNKNATISGNVAAAAGIGSQQLQQQGSPTVMAVSGIIAIGTTKGWTLVFDFGQTLRCVCGTEQIARESGAVTAVAISQDHTFVAVGHASGAIHLYSLAKPSQPARSVPPTTPGEVARGRKEGHLVGTRVLHLGFVGARHTAIVSGDELGLSFYHSLGKVLMLASTDIIRILGNYPDPTIPSPPVPLRGGGGRATLNGGGATESHSTRKKRSTILALSPLPLGPAPHPPSDPLSLVAILTPTKLVVVGLKPVARTWWRFSFPRATATASNGGDTVDVESLGGRGSRGGGERAFATSGVLGWWPSSRRSTFEGETEENGHERRPRQDEEDEPGEDPMLAWAWGRRVRLVRVKSNRRENEVVSNKKAVTAAGVEFVECGEWVCDSRVLALRWYSENVIIVLTSTHFDVFDVTTRERIGRDVQDLGTIVSNDFYSNAFDDNDDDDDDRSIGRDERLAYAASFTTYKRKLFLLGTSDVRAGAVLSWADNILALMQPSTILSAIELTTAYLEGRVDASTISLPRDPVLRGPLVAPKLREILNASLEFVFSEDRLRDGSHSDGESTKRLFEGLVATCVRACRALDDVDWLFDDLFERYDEHGIDAIFLDRIEPFVLAGAVDALPPSVSQRLIEIHAARGQYDAAERIMVSVDPALLDLDQALSLCQRHGLFDGLIHVYSQAIGDYVAPLVELVELVRKISRSRRTRPSRVGGGGEEDATTFELGRRRPSFGEEQEAEAMVPDAYKVFAYLSQALVGLSYPRKTRLAFDDAVKARASLYEFLFWGHTVIWPEKGGRPIFTSIDDDEDEPTYPYIRLLLLFDAEATLDTLDLAFEDSYLDDSAPSRQEMVDILLDIMPPSRSSPGFSPIDRTFFHIFLARNLAKYPQYIALPSATVHDVLVELATDSDQSTVEDRQLAAEYVLSTYQPPDLDQAIELFERAGFVRILRSIYRQERRWASLASTYLRDPDVGGRDLFDSLAETLKLAGRSSSAQQPPRQTMRDLASTILDAVPSLIQADEAGLERTARLFDSYLASRHVDVVAKLAGSEYRQFAYLRCLLEPSASSSEFSTAAATSDRAPSTKLDLAQRLEYLSLLAKHDPEHVIRYLESDDSVSKSDEAIKVCESREAFDAVVWALDRRGETKAALAKADETLETRTDALLHMLVGDRDDDGGEEEEEDDGPRSQQETGRNAESLLAQIAAISAAATTVCSIRSSGRRRSREIAPEDLWFGLLTSLVSTVRTIRSVVPSPSPSRERSRSVHHRRISNASIVVHDDDDDDEAGAALSPRAVDVLSSLIPTALSALVSTTSSREVSFPRLVRRLIDQNATGSPVAPHAADRSSYAEFKSIVSSMLDTYSFEGDLLELSSRISSDDLFENVAAYETERKRGWRPGGARSTRLLLRRRSATVPDEIEEVDEGACAECLQPVWGPRGAGQALTSPAMSRSASVSMVVEQLGMTGRPLIHKRPSLKGKEVDWPPPPPPPLHFAAASSAADDGNSSSSSRLVESGGGVPSRGGGGGGGGGRRGGGFGDLSPPSGVVIGRDGRLWHQTCHLLRSDD